MRFKLTATNLIIIILILCLISELILYQKISFLQTTNLTFMIAGAFLIIGLFWATLHSGVFDFFHYSLRRVAAIAKRKEPLVDDETELMALSRAVGTGYKYPLKVGFGLLIICLIALAGHYLF